ncbi:hypothetical protein VD659_16225 [Herbiconiux sp. 11R-BC]|uniref:hypothetical protein n=1 Tax=Herbiconiux sp. 11R-BC TaxID=3111637 RepID=UPI003BFE4513
MTITSSSGDATSPPLVLGYSWTHEVRNIVHPLLNTAQPAVTLRTGGAKRGTLRLFYLNEADALFAAQMHTGLAAFTILDSDHPALAMRYAVVGSVSVELDPSTMRRWVVSVDFQETALVVVPL